MADIETVAKKDFEESGGRICFHETDNYKEVSGLFLNAKECKYRQPNSVKFTGHGEVCLAKCTHPDRLLKLVDFCPPYQKATTNVQD